MPRFLRSQLFDIYGIMRQLMILIFILSVCHVSFADRSKKALKDLSANNFDDVIVSLEKDMAKDSLNAATHYIYALLWSKSEFKGYSIHKAITSLRNAQRMYDQTDPKRKAQLVKIDIDETSLFNHKKYIDSVAFGEAKVRHTIEGYEYFMAAFYDAKQRTEAEELRDVLAFEVALLQDTWQAYEQFFTRYPKARQVSVAKSKYDRLIFEDKTKSKNLAAYKKFLREFPTTPYRDIAEKAILEIVAVDHTSASYFSFLNDFPNTNLRKFVLDLLYHADTLYRDDIYFHRNFPASVQKDSIASLRPVERYSWLAIFEDGKYGFMTAKGDVMLPPKYDRIDQSYLCGNIVDDFLVIGSTDNSKTIINRAGKLFYSGAFENSVDLGAGLIWLKSGKFATVIHKSGATLFEGNFSDVKALSPSLIMVKGNDGQGLYSVLGKKLINPQYENIELAGDFIIIENEGRKALLTIRKLFDNADQTQLDINFNYEDAELVKNRFMIVADGDLEGVLDLRLETIVAMTQQHISPLANGWMLRNAEGYRIVYDQNPSEWSPIYENTISNTSWTAFKTLGKWTLRSNTTNNELSDLDSVAMIGKYAVYYEKGLQRLKFSTAMELILKPKSIVSVIGMNKANNIVNEYYQILENGRCIVYNNEGKLLFAERLDYVSVLMPGYFETSYGGKKGIIDSLGRFALETRYEAVGEVTDKLAMILNDGKFGLINLPKKRLIGASYEERLVEYNDRFLIAVQNGKKGLIVAENARKQVNFEFDDIKYWTDSIALVKKMNVWKWLDIYAGKTVDQDILSFKTLEMDDRHQVLIYLTNTGYGVMDNKKGVILKPVYNDIVNLGTDNDPVYFTEQHLPQAEFYVVTYTDALGNVLRSQAYRSSDYGKIYCER